ncbi:MarR family winged helix-turn-helix transcriptional regulator [Nonomuraea jiangxiensis]|uniref:DNA-binding transcriptional regulator, MarR family n=1 Tax=Nonomuraea jiangxiensis TaxID=633440 RepID=A0A1G9JM95_9ACTN|nr:MarR family winged helix-turn-helix transcriptional regulator [Nonomuraea jiangxiensis]SDL38697.1 DNA-binding transcriptional regulator, MarR family [Nonomuraea jiangxiensis]
MTTRAGRQGGEGAGELPFPALFTQAKDVMVAHLHQRLGEEGFEGIRFTHGSVFRFIDADGSRLTVLAERSGLSKQALGEVVSELERHGYVERTADPADHRAKIIRLTGRGMEAQLAAARILGDIEQRWARRLGQDRIAAMRTLLEELVRFEQGQDT